jgi:hypothetical protein
MPKDDSVFNMKLVEAVKRNPCLYDYNLKEYNNRDVVNVTWERVAAEMEDTGKPCYYYIPYFTLLSSCFNRFVQLTFLACTQHLNIVSYLLLYQFSAVANCCYEGTAASGLRSNDENTLL